MSIQKNIYLQVNHSNKERPSELNTIAPVKECEINVQVAAGWAVIGHYRGQILQTVTLKKSTEKETS